MRLWHTKVWRAWICRHDIEIAIVPAMNWPEVVELRQYTLRPGRRDDLIELFERHFVESQEATGITLLGTFRNLDDASKFVWLRGFPGMDERAKSLADFYYGPVWKTHGAAANVTMIDSDNVLLLNPFVHGTNAAMTMAPDALGREDRGIAEAILLPLAGSTDRDAVAAFLRDVEPKWASRAATLGMLVTSGAANTFPALPVREGESFLTWIVGYRDRTAYRELASAREHASTAARRLAGVTGEPQALRLEPTSRTAIHVAR